MNARVVFISYLKFMMIVIVLGKAADRFLIAARPLHLFIIHYNLNIWTGV